MGIVEATIGATIEVDSGQLPDAIVREILSALTITNPAKRRALTEMVRGAKDMPDDVTLYRNIGPMLILPRGFRASFQRGMLMHGYAIQWDDRRTYLPTPPEGWSALRPIELRGYQEDACQAMINGMDGFLKMPTGAGKTVVILEGARRVGQRAIVTVDKTSLAAQWHDRCVEFLGYEPGMIGEGQWDVRLITIAMRQTLWETMDSGGAVDLGDFFRYFGFFAVDEGHHVASADTLMEIVSRFYSMWRIGPTATPERDPEVFPVAKALLGPIIHETTPEQAGRALVVPRINVVRTEFDFEYVPTRRELNEKTGRERRVGNNYSGMMDELCRDPARNLLIVRLAMHELRAGHRCLIPSRRKEHLKHINYVLLEAMTEAEEEFPIYSLTADQTGKEAMEVAEKIPDSPCVLLSTIADEALDMPALDRLFLVYPVRKPAVVEQLVGRVMRQCEGKDGALVHDFRDLPGLLQSQARERTQRLYIPRRWPIEEEGSMLVHVPRVWN